MECFKHAFNILIVSDGMFSINLGGLQADLLGGEGGSGGGAPPRIHSPNSIQLHILVRYDREPNTVGSPVVLTDIGKTQLSQ